MCYSFLYINTKIKTNFEGKNNKYIKIKQKEEKNKRIYFVVPVNQTKTTVATNITWT